MQTFQCAQLKYRDKLCLSPYNEEESNTICHGDASVPMAVPSAPWGRTPWKTQFRVLTLANSYHFCMLGKTIYHVGPFSSAASAMASIWRVPPIGWSYALMKGRAVWAVPYIDNTTSMCVSLCEWVLPYFHIQHHGSDSFAELNLPAQKFLQKFIFIISWVEFIFFLVADVNGYRSFEWEKGVNCTLYFLF